MSVPNRTTAQPGSVIHGTMRPEDLITCFVSLLDELREERSLSADADAAQHERDDDILAEIERARGLSAFYYESEDAAGDLCWLFDALGEYAPDGHYFGAHEGDGSDYGFWECEDEA